MTRFQDAVHRVKNIFKISNVYDCARPLLLVLALFGFGATSIRKTVGVYSLHNTRITYLLTVIAEFMFAKQFVGFVVYIISIDSPELYRRVSVLIGFFTMSLFIFTGGVGYIATSTSCKRLDRMFQLIHKIDNQLEEVNIRVKHWQITLKVMIALVLANSANVEWAVHSDIQTSLKLTTILLFIIFDLFYTWVILIILIIHERFVCLNQLLQQNATVTNIHIVGERSLRDNYLLRRISLARHVHEQLTEVVQLFSDSCRYVIVGFLAKSTMQIINQALIIFMFESIIDYPMLVKCVLQTVLFISICQANKNQRRVLTARIRHLVAFETNREIIQQVQQYIMYNKYSVKGLIDLQFTDVDNVLLFLIIDVVASYILIIYSYNR